VAGHNSQRIGISVEILCLNLIKRLTKKPDILIS
jgi:hypothetical protein